MLAAVALASVMNDLLFRKLESRMTKERRERRRGERERESI